MFCYSDVVENVENHYNIGVIELNINVISEQISSDWTCQICGWIEKSAEPGPGAAVTAGLDWTCTAHIRRLSYAVTGLT